MQTTLKAILIDVQEKTVTDIEIPDTLEDMYRVLKCDTICSVSATDGEILWLDDNGLLIDHKLGAFKVGPRVFSGNGLILGIDETGANRSTTIKAIEIRHLIKFVDISELPEPTYTVYSFDHGQRN